MGNDGGTIPTRREILHFNSQNILPSDKSNSSKLINTNTSLKEFNLSRQINSFKYCKLSGKRLTEPIVSDYKGQLFNKEAVIEHLLKNTTTTATAAADNDLKSKQFNHLKSLKDIVEIKLIYDEKNETIEDPLTGTIFSISSATNSSPTKDNQIPITLCYLVPCGCTMDKKLLSELISIRKESLGKKSDISSIVINMDCPLCSMEFSTRDIIDLNSLDEDIKMNLEERIKNLKDQEQLSHSLKPLKKKNRKDKEKKKRKVDDGDVDDGNHKKKLKN